MEAAKGNRERRRDGLRVPGLAALEKFGKPSIRPFIPSVDESDPAWTFPVTHPVAGGCDHRALTDQTNPKTLEWPASVLKLICEENKIDAPREMVERIAAKQGKEADDVFTAKFRMDQYYGNEQNMKK